MKKIINKVKFRKFVTLLVCILMFSSTLVAAMTIDENIKTNYKVLAKVAEKKTELITQPILYQVDLSEAIALFICIYSEVQTVHIKPM